MIFRVKKMKETTWYIVPTITPNILRHCSKCNRKMPYYCSEKFRANANQSRVDIWLIYKCTKCDNTWKLTLYKGMRPHELPEGLFDKFVNNDVNLAWQYAFNRNFLKQHGYTVDYTNVDYTVHQNEQNLPSRHCEEYSDEAIQGFGLLRYARNDEHRIAKDCRGNDAFLLHVKGSYSFDLKLSALLARVLDTSIGQIKRLAESGRISTSLDIDIMKYRIKSEHDISIRIE